MAAGRLPAYDEFFLRTGYPSVRIGDGCGTSAGTRSTSTATATVEGIRFAGGLGGGAPLAKIIFLIPHVQKSERSSLQSDK